MGQWLFAALGFALFAGCASAPKGAALTQINTIDSLLAGVYDGQFALRDLQRHGDFGIGTFDRLDGEMLMFDGRIYQIKADGKAYTPALGTTTPFASVVRFTPSRTIEMGKSSLEELCATVDTLAPNRNVFAAVMVRGEFARVHTRSVPAQQKPYRPLAEVTKNQPEFKRENVKGTLVGFRLPAYVKGINVPGYHLHFVSDDLKFGGHLLDLELARGTLSLAQIHRLYMILPGNSGAFAQADLAKDRAAELNETESAKSRR